MTFAMRGGDGAGGIRSTCAKRPTKALMAKPPITATAVPVPPRSYDDVVGMSIGPGMMSNHGRLKRPEVRSSENVIGAVHGEGAEREVDDARALEPDNDADSPRFRRGRRPRDPAACPAESWLTGQESVVRAT